MHILWIKTELLHPVDKGGRIRTYQMLRSLSRRHHVTYLCLDDGLAASDAIERAREYAQELIVVPFRPAAKRSVGFWVDLLRNLFSPLPYAIARYRSPELRERVQQLAGAADLIVCDFLFPSLNVPDGLLATGGSLRAQCRSHHLAATTSQCPSIPCAAPICDFSGSACCGTKRENAGASRT